MPNGDPLNGFFYPTLTLMIDSYNPDHQLEDSVLENKRFTSDSV